MRKFSAITVSIWEKRLHFLLRNSFVLDNRRDTRRPFGVPHEQARRQKTALTAPNKYATYVVVSQKLNTTEAAKAVGLDRVTVQRWIRERKIQAPKPVLRKGRGVRLWSPRDIERLSRVKEQVYRRGRGRKPKPKV